MKLFTVLADRIAEKVAERISLQFESDFPVTLSRDISNEIRDAVEDSCETVVGREMDFYSDHFTEIERAVDELDMKVDDLVEELKEKAA